VPADYSVRAQHRWYRQRDERARAARIAAAKPSWDAWARERDMEEFVRQVAIADAPPSKEQIATFQRTHSPRGETK
jgi:hypothetical protein